MSQNTISLFLSLVMYWIGQKVWIDVCMMLQKNLNKLLANPIVIWNGQQSSRWLSGKELTYSAGDIRDSGSISGSGSFPGGGHGNPLQYSCLENPTDTGDLWAIVDGAAKSQTWLSNWIHSHIYIYTYLSIYLSIFNLKSLLANPSSLVNHFVMLNKISSRDSVDTSARAKKKKKRVMFAINK